MVSERGDFRLVVDELRMREGVFENEWRPPYLVLAGTRLCPELRCDACGDEGCEGATLQTSGPVSVDADGCYLADAPGEVVWSVDLPCGAPGQPADVVRMRVVAADEVEARAYHLIDGAVADLAARESSLVALLGAPWADLLPRESKVVAGEEVELSVGLFERASGHTVAHQAEPAAVTWTTVRGRPAVIYPDKAILRVTSFAGTESALAFEVAGHTWPIGQVTGVPVDAVTSLELAGALIFDDDPDAPLLGRTAVPLGARAVARDAAGDLVVGLPMSWSAEVGNVAYVPDFTRHERLLVADDCVPPDEREGRRALVLRGSGGGLSASLRFDWAGTAEGTIFTAPASADWQPAATCLEPAGCGCRSADPGGASLLLLGLLALRRRRKSHVREGMSFAACLSAPPLGRLASRRRRQSHVRKGMSFTACLFAPPLLGCGGEPPALAVAEALPLGGLPLAGFPDDGGHSVAVGGRAAWVFRDAHATSDYDTKSWAAVLTDLDASDGLHPFAPHFVNENGVADELLLLRKGETRATVGEPDGECVAAGDCPHLSLWPGPVVHDPARARVLVFYRKVVQAGAAQRHVGSSIAVWRDDFVGRPARPDLAPGSREPTLLFGADEPRLAAAALAEGEHVYAFACDGEDNPCVLLRAPLAHALGRAAWQRLGRDGEWSSSPRRDERLFAGAPTMSVHWSEHAGAYVAVYADPEGAAAVLRTAPRLEGPWSDAAELHRPDAPLDPVRVRDALLHPELAREGGLVEYLTYLEGIPGSEHLAMQLVEIRWE